MKSTARAVGIVMVIMVLSRLLSLVSSIIYTAFYGNTLEMNIYSYAIQFPNIMFTIFGTALATVVIPIFAGYIGTGEKERAFRFADNVTSLSLIFTFGLMLVGMVLAPVFPLFTSFRNQGYDFAVTALRIMFPVMVFYALNYILQGVLQSMGRFNMPAFVSVPSSLAVLLYVIFFGHSYGVRGLLYATFIGLSLQALVLVPPVLKTEYRYRPSLDYRDTDIRKALRLMGPVLIGTSAYQLNILFNVTMAARFENKLTIMVLVQNLILYSVLAFIYSVTAVVFPRFSMLAARNDMEEFKASLVKVLKSIMFFLIPATAGFIAIGPQLLNLLIAWGKMTQADVSFGGSVLSLYALSITGVGIKEVVDRAFYSINNTKKPAYNGIFMMLVNISASLILINFMGVLGIPLANSISALAGAAVITYMLSKEIGGFGGRSLAKSALKVIMSSIIMLAVILPLNWYLGRYVFGFSLTDRIIKLFVPVIAGGAVYSASVYLFRMEEAVEVLERLKNLLGKRRL